VPDYKRQLDYRAASCCLLCENSMSDGVTGQLRCDRVGNKVDATCVCDEFKEMVD
jgi:hypothetical protein